MPGAFASRRLPKRVWNGCLVSAVLLFGLLTAVPGAHADIIPKWKLITRVSA